MVMYSNEFWFETKENKVQTKDKIEPKHIYQYIFLDFGMERRGGGGGGGGGGWVVVVVRLVVVVRKKKSNIKLIRDILLNFLK